MYLSIVHQLIAWWYFFLFIYRPKVDSLMVFLPPLPSWLVHVFFFISFLKENNIPILPPKKKREFILGPILPLRDVAKFNWKCQIFFENNIKSQTILLVSIVLKLFGYLTTRDQKTWFWSYKSSITYSIFNWDGHLVHIGTELESNGLEFCQIEIESYRLI